MGRAVEHRWYGDVAPWSEEQLEQYCRDVGFSAASARGERPDARTMTSATFHCERMLRRSAARSMTRGLK